MSKTTKIYSYSSKLLLFGEHIIIKGADALAIPFPKFYGYWQYLNNDQSFSKQQSLSEFANYLETNLPETIDYQQLKNELNKGLYFQSDIPTGYGVGSSGALVAATFDRFGKGKEGFSKSELKLILAKMESFFHGSSSGTDPLICYLHEAILLKGKENLEAVQLPDFDKMGEWTLFLLDTKTPRQTSPFVNIFLKKCETPSFKKLIKSNLFPINSKAIQEFLAADWANLFHTWHQISEFQQQYFSEMITEKFLKIWQKGLDNNLFKLKLCGAGGGGFILGITSNFKQTKIALNKHSLLKI